MDFRKSYFRLKAVLQTIGGAALANARPRCLAKDAANCRQVLECGRRCAALDRVVTGFDESQSLRRFLYPVDIAKHG